MFYSQIDGLPMGSPLSPVLANIFMEYFESELLPRILDNNITWLRYVDDVFAVVPCSFDIQNFLESLNSLHPSIKFKVEIENNNALPFLDTLVIRSHNGYPKFKVFRKDTHSDSYIHAFSNHSITTKLGVMSNLFLRAYNICDNEFVEDEINYLRNVFIRHGYHSEFINKAHRKARKTYYRVKEKEPFLKENECLLLMPQTTSDNTYINTYLKDNQIVGVYKNMSTIKTMLNKVKIPESEQPCIYKLPCMSCDKVYIGESIDFERRKREHRDAIRKGDNNSAVFKHLSQENHPIDFNNMEKLITIPDTHRRKLIEAILIQNSKNFNGHQSNFKLDMFLNNIVKQNVTSINRLLENLNKPP